MDTRLKDERQPSTAATVPAPRVSISIRNVGFWHSQPPHLRRRYARNEALNNLLEFGNHSIISDDT
jgi:hypothetical protein